MSQQTKPLEGIMVFNESVIFELGTLPGKPFRAADNGFFVVQEGAFTFQCNLETVTCSKGSLCFLIQGTVYAIESVSADFRYMGMTFSADFLLQNGVHNTGSEMFHLVVAGASHQYYLNNGEAAMMLDMLTLVNTRMKAGLSGYFRAEVVQHLVMGLIFEAASLSRKYNDSNPIILNRKEELTARFLELLPLHCREERSLQFYAGKLSVTTGHLAKVVKQVLTRSASELIDAAVITEAKMLLGNSTLSIAQVAASLQFSDQSFFGKYFKKHAGVSPSVYRQGVWNGDRAVF